MYSPTRDVVVTTIPANTFPNNLALDVLHKMPRNPPFCYFVSFLIVLLKPFINKPDSSTV